MSAAGSVFRKTLRSGTVDAEVRGWEAVAPYLRVPRLLGVDAAAHEVVYEDVFGDGGGCSLLLGDVIGLADLDPAQTGRVIALIDAVCDDLQAAAAATGCRSPLSSCVPALYQDRIRPGGRIGSWYLRNPPMVSLGRGHVISVRELAAYEIVVNGVVVRLDLPEIMRDARELLAGDGRWVTAVTQGDPTEPNIADPLCWLDFEYAGRNTLAGEIATLLWYLLSMGGWLVPVIQPEVYARTLRLALRPVATPRIEQHALSMTTRWLEVTYTWDVGAGRHAAVHRLVERIHVDLAATAGIEPDQFLRRIRGFLAARILGVFAPATLSDGALLLILAKLAESQSPATTLEDFARTTITAERGRR
ncbi:hypothetical protein GCM10015535_58530 [Streptomyces gelaticus]|uniref:Uncharacterized protein n=1 Tax=Streptomyces gelaticus TaxID=285446 RepID=A0ABQ2W907_9ACTN|nr:hypothetical protein [Streptomyces gelaticus]GGV94067.1 hypothetical protein GCM10015535_58530 [Streptomyces gelaticus]